MHVNLKKEYKEEHIRQDDKGCSLALHVPGPAASTMVPF